jgi:hypothetical protein
MVGDRVFLLLFEYPTNTSERPFEEPVEKWYRLGAEDYVWVISGGTIYNRWERYMKENLDAPREVIRSYGWAYSLGEFLDLVSAAISDPEKADAYSVKPLPTQQMASIVIALVVILPSVFIATVAIRNQKRLHKENAT